MKRALEFHDSVIGSVAVEGNGLTIELSPAYIHESDGNPGISPGKGYSQIVRLRFTGLRFPEAILPAPSGTIWDASIKVGAANYDNMLPMPFTCAGEVVANFVLAEGHLVVFARTIDASSVGEARYVEEFPGAV
jgi:hypothetical protein